MCQGERLSLGFIGAAWDEIRTEDYMKLRRAAWQRTGCLLTADGTEDAVVTPQGLSDYTPPPPGTWDAAWA